MLFHVGSNIGRGKTFHKFFLGFIPSISRTNTTRRGTSLYLVMATYYDTPEASEVSRRPIMAPSNASRFKAYSCLSIMNILPLNIVLQKYTAT